MQTRKGFLSIDRIQQNLQKRVSRWLGLIWCYDVDFF